jgi:hypothetical protein
VAVLVYGFVRAGHRLADAVTRAGVRAIPVGSISALVASIADDAVLRDDDVDAYLDALIGALEDGPVLPVEFGTVADDDEDVKAQLELDADMLGRRLDQVDGLIEVRVDVDTDEAAAIRTLVATDPSLAHIVRSGGLPKNLSRRVALGEQIGVALAELSAALGRQMLERLGDLAVEHTERPSASVTELRHAFLIRADDLAAFDQAVGELRAELEPLHQLEYVGPLPAFDFTDARIEAGPRSESSAHRWGW